MAMSSTAAITDVITFLIRFARIMVDIDGNDIGWMLRGGFGLLNGFFHCSEELVVPAQKPASKTLFVNSTTDASCGSGISFLKSSQ